MSTRGVYKIMFSIDRIYRERVLLASFREETLAD